MKVLLALDGSAPSLVARDLVAGLHWPDGTVVHLVSAYHVPVDWTGGVGSTMDWIGEVEDAVRDELSQSQASAGETLTERGLRVERHVLRGRAADVIIDLARQLQVDLLVTGSRGRGPVRSMLLGSVAGEVATHAPCPVLVARRSAVTRLLVASDGSGCAERVPPLLAAWGCFAGLPADAVAVAVPDSPAFELMASLYSLGDERVAREREAVQRHATDNADDMARLLGAAGIPATPRVRSGDAAAQILAAADEAGADLVVTGSRCLGAVERLVLGSVARNVLLHANASVLIVRTGVPDQPSDQEALP